MEYKTGRAQSKHNIDMLQSVSRNKQSVKSVKDLIGKFDQNDSESKTPDAKDKKSFTFTSAESKGFYRTLENNRASQSDRDKLLDARTRSNIPEKNVGSKALAYERLTRTLERKVDPKDRQTTRSFSADRSLEYNKPKPSSRHRERCREVNKRDETFDGPGASKLEKDHQRQDKKDAGSIPTDHGTKENTRESHTKPFAKPGFDTLQATDQTLTATPVGLNRRDERKERQMSSSQSQATDVRNLSSGDQSKTEKAESDVNTRPMQRERQRNQLNSKQSVSTNYKRLPSDDHSKEEPRIPVTNGVKTKPEQTKTQDKQLNSSQSENTDVENEPPENEPKNHGNNNTSQSEAADTATFPTASLKQRNNSPSVELTRKPDRLDSKVVGSFLSVGDEASEKDTYSKTQGPSDNKSSEEQGSTEDTKSLQDGGQGVDNKKSDRENRRSVRSFLSERNFDYDSFWDEGRKNSTTKNASGVKQFVDTIEKAKSNISTAIQKQNTPSWRRNKSENESELPIQGYKLRKAWSQTSLDNDSHSVTSLNDNKTSFGPSSSSSRFPSHARSSRHRRKERSQNNDPGTRSASVGKTSSRDTSPWISSRRQSREKKFSFEDTEVFVDNGGPVLPRGATEENIESSSKKDEPDIVSTVNKPEISRRPNQNSHSTGSWSDSIETSKGGRNSLQKQASHSAGSWSGSQEANDAPQSSNQASRTKFHGPNAANIYHPKYKESEAPKLHQGESTSSNMFTESPNVKSQNINMISPKPFSKANKLSLSSSSDTDHLIAKQTPSYSQSETTEDQSSSLKPIDISKYLISSQTAEDNHNPEMVLKDQHTQQEINPATENPDKALQPVIINGGPSQIDSDSRKSIFPNEEDNFSTALPVSNEKRDLPPPLPSTPPPQSSQLQVYDLKGDHDSRDEVHDDVFLPNKQNSNDKADQAPKTTSAINNNVVGKLESSMSSSSDVIETEPQISDKVGGMSRLKSSKTDNEGKLNPVENGLPKQIDENNKSSEIQSEMPNKNGLQSIIPFANHQNQSYVYHKIFKFVSKNLQKPWTDFMASLFEAYPEWFVRWKEGDIRKESDNEQECVYTCLVLWRDLHADLADDILLDDLKDKCSRSSMHLTEGIDEILRETRDANKKYLAYLDDTKLSSLALEMGPNEWKILGSCLGHSSAQLHHLESDHQGNIGGAIQQLLVDWRCTHGADVNQLVTGLIRSNREDLLRFLKPIRY